MKICLTVLLCFFLIAFIASCCFPALLPVMSGVLVTGGSLLSGFMLRGKTERKRRIGKLSIGILTMFLLTGCGLDASETDETVPAVTASVIKESERAETSQESNSGMLPELEIFYIDCGQGDATLIKCKDHAMLIDAGGNDKGTAIQLFLKKQDIKTLDYVIGTHPDEDHIGGLDVIITKFDCKNVMIPEIGKDTDTYRDVIDAMEYKNYNNTIPAAGSTYELGDAEFTIIAPNGDYGGNYNNWSVGLILTHGSNRFLFTGDAEAEAEKDIASNGIDISCDVYKAGHHGSSTSTTDVLLKAADPAFAVISCGQGNSYGHPDSAALDRLKAKGAEVFRTDRQGTIAVISDGKNLSWSCSPDDIWKAGMPVTGESTAVRPESAVTATETEKSGQSGQITYVLNISSRKFHYPVCRSLPTKNREDSNMSRDEIISQGYSPCKNCNP